MSRRTPKLRRPSSMANSGIRHVGLKVRDLEKSVEFYKEVLGLDSSERKNRVARIRSGRDTLVLQRCAVGGLASTSVSAWIHPRRSTSGKHGLEPET